MNLIYNMTIDSLRKIEQNIDAMADIWKQTESNGKYLTLPIDFMRDYLPKEATRYKNELNQIKKLLEMFPKEFTK